VDGLWTIEFGSSTGTFGSGVVVVRSGKIAGGDASYYYVGSYEDPGPTHSFPRAFRARLHVTPFIPGAASVFGTVGQDYFLILEGTLKDANNATAVGKPENVPGMNVGMRLRRRSEAI
jgi:hypothetical protein